MMTKMTSETGKAQANDVSGFLNIIQEANMGPLHKTIFKEPLVFENGYIIPPTGPGLGVEFDTDVLKQHLVE